MDIKNRYGKEKEYMAETSHVKRDAITKISLSLGLIIFLFFAKNDFEWNGINASEALFVIIASGLLFMLIVFHSSVIKNYRVAINDEYIKFLHFIKFQEPDEYKWEDTKIIIIGDVEIKHARYNQAVFGVEIFYRDNYYKKLTSDAYKLDHLQNYDQLIDDIIDKCNKHSIKYEDAR